MNLSLGGLSWLSATIAWAFLSPRLYRQFRKDKGKISKFFTYFSVCLMNSFALFSAERLFFAGNTLMLRLILVLGNLFLITGFLCLGYLLIYIKFPQVPARLVLIPFLILDLTVAVFNILLPPNSLYEEELVVGYFPNIIPGVLMFGIITFISIPLGIILIQKVLSFSSSEERIKSFGLGILCFSGIIVAFFSAILKTDSIRSTLMIGWSIGILLLTVFTQKRHPHSYIFKV